MRNLFKKIFRFLFPIKVDKKTIRAFHEDGLDFLLKKLDMADRFKKGELFCSFCNSPINKENIECILSFEGEIRFCCDKLDCYTEALKIELSEKEES